MATASFACNSSAFGSLLFFKESHAWKHFVLKSTASSRRRRSPSHILSLYPLYVPFGALLRFSLVGSCVHKSSSLSRERVAYSRRTQVR